MGGVAKVKASELNWKNVDKDVVLKVVDLCDGHSIHDAESLATTGAPSALIAKHVRMYVSNKGEIQHTIFVDGKAVDRLIGVSGLDLIKTICLDLGIDYVQKSGRGSQYCACAAAIYRHFEGVTCQR